jgi:hypothetical protein
LSYISQLHSRPSVLMKSKPQDGDIPRRQFRSICLENCFSVVVKECQGRGCAERNFQICECLLKHGGQPPAETRLADSAECIQKADLC